MRINSNFITYKNKTQNSYNTTAINSKTAVKPLCTSFSGLVQRNTFKALVLSLVALVTTPSIYAKTVDKFADFKGKNIPLLGLPAQIKKPPIPRVLCADTEIFNYTDEIQTLSKQVPFKLSYYFSEGKSEAETIAEKAQDYKKLIEDIPQKIAKKGLPDVLSYQKSVISILKTCGEYGALYIKNIPDKENMIIHAQGLQRLLAAAKKIQGCEFNNAALFNGFSADDLMRKVVIPNEKVAKGEIIGAGQNNLIIVTHEFGCDDEGNFKGDFSGNTYLKKHLDFPGGTNFDFQEGFLEHYNNILVIQPSGNADNVLSEAFAKIEKALFKGSKTDIIAIGHGVNNSGIELSRKSNMARGNSLLLNSGDFLSVAVGGQPFAQSIARIFNSAIEQGYNPRFIGDGCDTEFLQSSLDTLLGKNSKNVRVFGTPYSIRGVSYLGFSKDGKLSFIAEVNPFFNDKYGLLVEITEAEGAKPDWYRTQSFFLNDDSGQEEKAEGLDRRIIDGFRNGTLTGTAYKPDNNMAMNYQVIEFSNPK